MLFKDNLCLIFQKKDGCDNLLTAERKTLLKLKKTLETKLKSVQQQLQFLDNARKRLKAVLSERNRVLDLICRDSASARIKKSNNKEMLMSGLSGIYLFTSCICCFQIFPISFLLSVHTMILILINLFSIGL